MDRFICFFLPEVGRWVRADTKHGFFELHDAPCEGEPVYELVEKAPEPKAPRTARAEGETFQTGRVSLSSGGVQASGTDVAPHGARAGARRRKTLRYDAPAGEMTGIRLGPPPVPVPRPEKEPLPIAEKLAHLVGNPTGLQSLWDDYLRQGYAQGTYEPMPSDKPNLFRDFVSGVVGHGNHVDYMNGRSRLYTDQEMSQLEPIADALYKRYITTGG